MMVQLPEPGRWGRVALAGWLALLLSLVAAAFDAAGPAAPGASPAAVVAALSSHQGPDPCLDHPALPTGHACVAQAGCATGALPPNAVASAPTAGAVSMMADAAAARELRTQRHFRPPRLSA